ncbi:MAG: branched-chain amino acid ABC transporter permease [Chloroflexi bacterium]|nr:branched-chain amino acid ABC transporter permease [Chloroflexota bacterium]
MSDLPQLLAQGLALGAVYGLTALGFVIVYKATAVINFAHGELLLLGAYLVYALHVQAGIPFVAAVPVAMACMAVGGWSIERGVLRRMVGRPTFAVVMITIGLAIVLRQAATAIWGFDDLLLGDPWGASQVTLGELRVNAVSIASLAAAGALFAAFLIFFRSSKAGIAMRSTAIDQEAALAVGIPVRAVYAWSWMLAGATAAVAGVFLAAFPATLHPALGFVAFRAFPAAIVGGLDSPGGAIVGGLLVGVTELLVQGYQPRLAPWLGDNFHVAASYLLMIVVLVVRPYGLFGTREVERV